ncbi:MAG: hypothetical protein D6679_12580 [Candidatus Hydrogenedentota bacterium]|nr:MAG: hypothetical protein D6679_12580 [Candidatus Hydrogenedentota bacterium]
MSALQNTAKMEHRFSNLRCNRELVIPSASRFFHLFRVIPRIPWFSIFFVDSVCSVVSFSPQVLRDICR